MRNVEELEVLLNLISVNEAPRDARVIELYASPPWSIHSSIYPPPTPPSKSPQKRQTLMRNRPPSASVVCRRPSLCSSFPQFEKKQNRYKQRPSLSLSLSSFSQPRTRRRRPRLVQHRRGGTRTHVNKRAMYVCVTLRLCVGQQHCALSPHSAAALTDENAPPIFWKGERRRRRRREVDEGGSQRASQRSEERQPDLSSSASFPYYDC